jgi:hypothetical protein
MSLLSVCSAPQYYCTDAAYITAGIPELEKYQFQLQSGTEAIALYRGSAVTEMSRTCRIDINRFSWNMNCYIQAETGNIWKKLKTDIRP